VPRRKPWSQGGSSPHPPSTRAGLEFHVLATIPRMQWLMPVLADSDESNSCDNDLLPPYHCLVRRSDSWSRPAGGNPVRADAAVPGSGPRFVAEPRRAERESKVSFGGSKRAGHRANACDLGKRTAEEPSRSGHGEGHPGQALVRGQPARSAQGTEGGTCTWLGPGQERPGRLACVTVRYRRPRDHTKKIIAKSYVGTRTYGSKGGWETGLQRHHAPDYQWISGT
jgi:hypothetical protein